MTAHRVVIDDPSIEPDVEELSIPTLELRQRGVMTREGSISPRQLVITLQGRPTYIALGVNESV